MEPPRGNQVLRKRDDDKNRQMKRKFGKDDRCETIPEKFNCGPFDFNISNVLNQILEKERKVKRLKFEDVKVCHHKDLEEDLKQSKRKYQTEVAKFKNQVENFYNRIKQKAEVNDSAHGMLTNLVRNIQSKFNYFADITREASELLLVIDEKETVWKAYYKETIEMAAIVVNRYIELTGHSGETNGIKQVEINDQKSPNDVAKECIEMINQIKAKGQTSKEIKEEDNLAFELSQIEIIEKQMAEYHEKIECGFNETQAEVLNYQEEETKLKKNMTAINTQEFKTIEAHQERMIEMFKSSAEKTSKFTIICKEIDEMNEKLKDKLNFYQQRDESALMCIEFSNKFNCSEAQSTQIEFEINQIIEKNAVHEKEIEEKDKIYENLLKTQQTNIEEKERLQCSLETDLTDATEKRDNLFEEYKSLYDQFTTIESDYKNDKAKFKTKRADKKRALKEKSRKKESLNRELLTLSLTMGRLYY